MQVLINAFMKYFVKALPSLITWIVSKGLMPLVDKIVNYFKRKKQIDINEKKANELKNEKDPKKGDDKFSSMP